MEAIEIIDTIIKDTFYEFIDRYENKYEKLYQNFKEKENIAKLERHCINPWLLTEDALKVKFGGMLESKIIEKYPMLTVSSELKIYADKTIPNHQCADLTIHKINNKLWTKNNDIIENLIAVIEIKYANLKTPYFDFRESTKHNIKDDISKLSDLNKPFLLKYLLLFDEGNRLNDKNDTSNKYTKYYKKMIDDAKIGGIIILSNNKTL